MLRNGEDGFIRKALKIAGEDSSPESVKRVLSDPGKARELVRVVAEHRSEVPWERLHRDDEGAAGDVARAMLAGLAHTLVFVDCAEEAASFDGKPSYLPYGCVLLDADGLCGAVRRGEGVEVVSIGGDAEKAFRMLAFVESICTPVYDDDCLSFEFDEMALQGHRIVSKGAEHVIRCSKAGESKTGLKTHHRGPVSPHTRRAHLRMQHCGPGCRELRQVMVRECEVRGGGQGPANLTHQVRRAG